ncbi:MAG: hypothetical protein UU14_C0037G0025, partial [Candidatus Roizmanbacteria bacterium GW2011_GWB1_40_7]
MPNKSAQNRSYLSISEAAEFLGINPMTLRRWDRSGKLKSYKTKGQHRRYRLKDLEAIAAKRNFQLPYGSIQQVIDEHPVHQFEPKVIHDTEEFELPPDPPHNFPKLKYAALIVVFLLLVVSALSFAGFVGNPASDFYYFLTSYNNNLANQKSEKEALSDTSVTAQIDQSRNVLGERTGDSLLTVNSDTRINGLLEALGGIATYGENADLGEGELTASNVIYSIIAGEGIGVSTGQNPTITNTDLGSDQNIFGNVTVGSTTISASSNTDTLTLKSGGSVSLSTSGKEITISASDSNTTYSAGTDLDLTSTTFSLETTLDSVTTINLSGTGTISAVDVFTAADGGLIDLSSIVHDDSAAQGLKLPQNSSLTAISNGEGFIAWDTDDNKVQVFDGTSWTQVGNIDGSGIGNYIPLWSDTDTLTTSRLYQTGGNLGIGTTTPTQLLDVNSILVVDNANQRVGVGVTSPAYKLHVAGDTLAGNILLNSSNIGLVSDTDLLALSSNLLTVNGALTATGAISGSTLTDGTTTFADSSWTSTS